MPPAAALRQSTSPSSQEWAWKQEILSHFPVARFNASSTCSSVRVETYANLADGVSTGQHHPQVSLILAKQQKCKFSY